MGKSGKGSRGFLPAVLLAVALAESAHAPLRSGALGSTQAPAAGSPSAGPSHTQTDLDKKTPAPLEIPPTPDFNDPSVVKKKYQEIEGEKPFSYSVPRNPLEFTLAAPATNPPPASQLDLLATPVGATGAEATGFEPPSYPPLPPATVAPTRDTGFTAPVIRAQPILPPQPVFQQASPQTSVPEPTMISILLGTLMFSLRPARLADKPTITPDFS